MSLRKAQKAPSLKGSPRRGGAFVLFILDPFETPSGRYNFEKDTSHLLMLELQRRGHTVCYSDPRDLMATEGCLSVKTRRVEILDKAPYFFFEEGRYLELDRFQLIWVRKDPPVDAAYLYMTQLLSLVSARVPVLNAPRALRDWNEKLTSLRFPRWMPPTLVSSDKHEISRFLEERGRAVLKPLSGFAGLGVRLLSLERKDEAHEEIDAATRIGTLPVIIQAYLDKVRLGEKRIFLVEGRPLGALLKIPREGFLANPDQGARVVSTSLTAREKKICADLSPFLRKEGVFFAGIDLIDGALTDINVTSPGLVWEWNEAENKRHERTIVDRVEKRFLKR